MLDILKSLPGDFAKKGAYDIFKAILKLIWEAIRIIAPFLFVYLALFTDFFQSFSWGSMLLGIIIGLVIFSTTGLLVHVRRRFDLARPRFPRIESDFEVLEMKLFYDHKALNRMVYTKRKKLRALRNNLKSYEGRYGWTGRGKNDIKCLKAGQTVAKTERRSIWQYYEVKFERVLKKGEVVDVDLQWDLFDEEGTAVPFMSATIEEPTRSLSLKVKFPDDSDVKQVIEEISPFIGSRFPISSVERQVTGKDYEFVPSECKILHHYELRWNWNN